MTYIFNFWKSKNTLPNNCLVKEEIKADTADYFKTNSKKKQKNSYQNWCHRLLKGEERV